MTPKFYFEIHFRIKENIITIENILFMDIQFKSIRRNIKVRYT